MWIDLMEGNKCLHFKFETLKDAQDTNLSLSPANAKGYCALAYYHSKYYYLTN